MERQYDADGEIEIDLKDLFFELVNNWMMIGISTVLVALIMFCISKFILVPEYTSTSELYVLSNSMYSTNLIEKELEEVGIKDYFIQIISSGDHLVRKPSSDLFKLYLKKFSMMGYKYSEICYIGNDYYYDIETPVKLGMMSVHLSDKFMVHKNYLEVDSYLKLIEEFKKYE